MLSSEQITLAEKFGILQELENFYDAMLPAQEKTNKAFIWFSGVPHPLFNTVTHFSCDRNLSESIDSIIKKAPPGTPLSFWVHALNKAEDMTTILKERGFRPISISPAMAWSVKSIAMPDYDIRKTNKEIFYQILADAFFFDKAVKDGYTSLLQNIEAENYLIYLEDKPVGTGTLFSNEKTKGIFNIAVLPDYQKKGLGKAMMQFLMKRAYDLKLNRLVLRSSSIAQKFYLDLGFVNYFDIEIFARYL